MSKKAEADEGINNPALFAGLKFYDVLMTKQKSFTILAHTGELYQWRDALEDYYASTSSYISKSDRESIEQKLQDASAKINNYLQYKDRAGILAINLRASVRRDLFNLQRSLMEATDHLNLKSSKGDSGKFDARRLFST